jgi:hypothetical protein
MYRLFTATHLCSRAFAASSGLHSAHCTGMGRNSQSRALVRRNASELRCSDRGRPSGASLSALDSDRTLHRKKKTCQLSKVPIV